MEASSARALRLRALVLWSAVTLGGLALGTATAPGVRALVLHPGPGFAELLVQCCSLAALLAGAMLWVATCDVAGSVLRSPAAAARRSLGPVRRALLATCGLAVVASATSGAAVASTDVDAPGPASLSGLPLPDRAEGGAPTPAAAPAVVRVRDGDSLWSISATVLGPSATDAEIAEHWRRVYAANADRIGADPDLIRPGLALRVPADRT